MATQVNAEQASEPSRFEPKAVVPVAIPPTTEPPSSVENTPLLTLEEVKSLALVMLGADGLMVMTLGVRVCERMVSRGLRRMSTDGAQSVSEAMTRTFGQGLGQASDT